MKLVERKAQLAFFAAVTLALALGLLLGVSRADPSPGTPPLPTTCASGMVVDQIPGTDPAPDGVTVVVDTGVSPFLYGASVNVTDGIDASEMPIVSAVASHLKFCLVQDPVEGDHWATIYVP